MGEVVNFGKGSEFWEAGSELWKQAVNCGGTGSELWESRQ